MKQLAIENIPESKKDTTKKKQLLGVIQKKRAQLQQLVIKTEMLRVNLDMAKQEYMVKVGSLFLKDNHLDLEIIRYKNILRLMQDGLSFDQAVEELAQTFYAQQLEIEKEQEKIKREEEIFLKRNEQVEEPSLDIKKIWKKLIAKFHPDLVQNQVEKKKRDTVMKQINRAYQEGDYDQLLRIERDNLPQKETTIDNLEEILEMVLLDIDRQIAEYKELKVSEWYSWMEKINHAKKTNKNIFADTERMLLDDIVVKLDLLNVLKDQIKAKEKNAVLF
jgi:hypothetical protein